MRVLFIDDLRMPPMEATIARTYDEAIRELHRGGWDLVSFDHDLGTAKSGYDIAKYIVENQISIGAFTIHSMNPVGRENIKQLLEHYGYLYVG